MAAFQKHAPAASQSTKTTSGRGQNRPDAGGPAGAGKSRGKAPLKSATVGTIDTKQPGALTGKAAQDLFAKMQREAKTQKR